MSAWPGPGEPFLCPELVRQDTPHRAPFCPLRTRTACPPRGRAPSAQQLPWLFPLVAAPLPLGPLPSRLGGCTTPPRVLQAHTPLRSSLTRASVPWHVLFPLPGMLVPFFAQPCLLFSWAVAKPPVQGVISAAWGPPDALPPSRVPHASRVTRSGPPHPGEGPRFVRCGMREAGGSLGLGGLAGSSRQGGGWAQARKRGAGGGCCSQTGRNPVSATRGRRGELLQSREASPQAKSPLGAEGACDDNRQPARQPTSVSGALEIRATWPGAPRPQLDTRPSEAPKTKDSTHPGECAGQPGPGGGVESSPRRLGGPPWPAPRRPRRSRVSIRPWAPRLPPATP